MKKILLLALIILLLPPVAWAKEPGVMELTGTMYGIFYSNETRFDQKMFRYEGRYFFGTVNYDGALSNGTPITIDGISDSGYELRWLSGRGNVYAGLGYRYLNDNSQLKSVYGYQRESHYYYFPLGVDFSRQYNNNGFFEATVEYDLFITGKQISHLSDVSAQYNDVTSWQHSGYGLTRFMQGFGELMSQMLIAQPILV